MNKLIYDIIIPVGSQHAMIVSKTIHALFDFFDFNNLWIIADEETIALLKNQFKRQESILFIAENEVIPDVNKNTLIDYFKKRKENPNRAGWYFQQFLKMQMASFCHPINYLIWDADTIPLKKIDFFNEQKNLLQTSLEYHEPYFETLKSILNLEKSHKNSFITEHMMVSCEIMKKLIDEIKNINSTQAWPMTILDNINSLDLSKSGFSEYETYGTYLFQKYPQNFKFRTGEEILTTLRHGSKLFSSLPHKNDMTILRDLGYDYVTFEIWDNQNDKLIRKNKKISLLYSKMRQYRLSLFSKILRNYFIKTNKQILIH